MLTSPRTFSKSYIIHIVKFIIINYWLSQYKYREQNKIVKNLNTLRYGLQLVVKKKVDINSYKNYTIKACSMNVTCIFPVHLTVLAAGFGRFC